ncbi:MAG TPA: hypothetical protein EYP04_05220, partial [Anaerolineae bacterium]|nr:hypothetical protein [Anaerolineae bacterium]
LLGIPRADIEAYVAEQGLEPRFDRSNLDTTYYRNRLRHELLPLLETYNPGVHQVLRRTATVLADDYALLRQELEKTWQHVVITENDRAVVFDLAGWRALPRALQRGTLREAVHRLRRTLRNVNFVHIENALWLARDEHRGAGTQATLPRGLLLTVGYDQLTIADEGYVPQPENLPLLPSGTEVHLVVPGTTYLPGMDWQVEVSLLDWDELPVGWDKNLNRWLGYLDADQVRGSLRLRTRRPGERFQPLGMRGHTVRLNEFMINLKLPAGWRDGWPLLADDQRILWLVGYRPGEPARITETTRRVLQVHLTRA